MRVGIFSQLFYFLVFIEMVKRRKLRPSSTIVIPSTACCPGHYLEEIRKSREKSFSVSNFEEMDFDFEFAKDYSTFEKREKHRKTSIKRNLKSLLGVSFKFDKNFIKFNSAFGHYGR